MGAFVYFQRQKAGKERHKTVLAKQFAGLQIPPSQKKKRQ